MRIQNLGADLVRPGQGIPFFHAGQDILRSKSMDRDSYNSGDWFNQIDWSLDTSDWGHGLPVADKNLSSWPIQQPLLANPALAPAKADRERAFDHFREVLEIRKSSPLFRLRTDTAVTAHLAFRNTGPAQVPGLVVMDLADTAGTIDRHVERIEVLFNARTTAEAFAVPALAGAEMELHPVQEASTDPIVRLSAYDPANGTFTVPARTTAVFLAPRPLADQIELLMDDVEALVSAGVLSTGQGTALTAKLAAAIAQLRQGNPNAAAGTLGAFLNQVAAFVQAGILTPEEAQGLLDEATYLRGQVMEG